MKLRVALKAGHRRQEGGGVSGHQPRHCSHHGNILVKGTGLILHMGKTERLSDLTSVWQGRCHSPHTSESKGPFHLLLITPTLSSF